MMRQVMLVVSLLLCASVAVAVTPDVPSSVLFLEFVTQADLPTFDYYGNGVVITNGQVPHGGIAAVGVQLRGTTATHNWERWTVEWVNPSGGVYSSDQLNYIGVQPPNGPNFCWQYVCGWGRRLQDMTDIYVIVYTRLLDSAPGGLEVAAHVAVFRQYH